MMFLWQCFHWYCSILFKSTVSHDRNYRKEYTERTYRRHILWFIQFDGVYIVQLIVCEALVRSDQLCIYIPNCEDFFLILNKIMISAWLQTSLRATLKEKKKVDNLKIQKYLMCTFIWCAAVPVCMDLDTKKSYLSKYCLD